MESSSIPISTQNSIISQESESTPLQETKNETELSSTQNKPISLISLSTFEENLWGQYEPLHKINNKKLECYEKFYKKFELIYSKFLDIMKNLKDIEFSLNRHKISLEHNSTLEKIDIKYIFKKVPNTLNSIKNIIEQQIEETNKTIAAILLSFSNYIKNMKEEKKEYDDFQKICNSYNSSSIDRKKILEKNMNIYHQKGQEAERAVLSLKKIEETSENISEDASYFKAIEKANNTIDDYIKPYNIYKENVKKENELRKEYIQKQKHLLKIYYDLENKNDSLNDEIIQIFLQHTNNRLMFEKENMDDFDFKKKNMKKGENLNDLVNNLVSNLKPEDNVKFSNFPSIIDFDMCDSDNTFKIYLESILFIKKFNTEEYPNFDEKVEKEKNDMREIISKLFDTYSEENESKIMNYLQNPLRHNSIFTILSKFRNKNCLNKDKKLFNMLGKVLNIILDESYINKNYENAKYCIIFSQIFFYISDDNIKHFLSEKIKYHKWLTTLDFWKNYIFINLNEELNKFLSFYDDIKIKDIEEKNEKIIDKIKLKLQDLLFSQILLYMNNMNQVGIDKEIIEKIVEEFCSKFKYLNEEKIDGILSIVFKENKEKRKIKERIKDYIVDYNPDKKNDHERSSFKTNRSKRSVHHINYDHLKKEEKQIENPL